MKGSMLIVDDEETIRWALQELLMADGWEVHAAADGDEAARMLADTAYDLLIADLRMPGRSAFELTGEGRRRNPAMGLIVLTGYGALENAIEALRLGAWDYLIKPPDTAYLRRRIAELLGRPRRAGRPREAPSADDVAAFLAGAGTQVLPVAPLTPDEANGGALRRIRDVFRDAGIAADRAEQLLQPCVEAVAALSDGRSARGRVALWQGRLLVGVTGESAPDAALCRSLEAYGRECAVDVRVVRADGVCHVVVIEDL